MSTKFESLADASRFALTPERQARLLDSQTDCTFCWTSSSGHPAAVTQAFVYRDGEFWMVSEASRARVRAIRRDPRSCVVVAAHGRSRTLTFKGHTEVLEDRSVVLRVLRDIARRYDPHDEQAQEAHVAAADSPGRVVLRFTPEKITNAFDGSLARTTT